MSARPSMADRVGTTPLLGGRYQVERLLGRGGNSTVHAVIDVATERRLALKQLHAGAKASSAALFEREYRTLAGLRHPCIVEVYDYRAEPDGTFYTMELLEGSDLSGLAPMPWREACACLRDAASIVGLLHARGLVHRDLSPKNLWRMPNGRIKLIDFGALAPFGHASHVLGTPPFVAPEAVHAAPLDQRADLFALGALGYWLITATHAYPARALAELPAVHMQLPVAPSTLMTPDTLDPLPPELDALLLSLLRTDPSERIGSTSALIDSLNAIAELEPENADVVQGYFESKVFVGRARELGRANALMHAVRDGGTVSVVVEGLPGSGRSRLLEELVVMGRVAGARTLTAGADSATRPYGVANTLALTLLATLPVAAEKAAEPHAAMLGHLSPELRARLGVDELALLTKAPRDARSVMQNALCTWFLSVARDHFLGVFIDDLHALDEESQAFLAALARATGEHRLFIAATLEEPEHERLSPTVHGFREGAVRLTLGPLAADETRSLLRSVFGDATYLGRLAERLHRVCEGHPAYCLELAEHLIRTGTARYDEGMWQLPPELSPEQLPKSRAAGITARLGRISPQARSLGQLLSLPHDGSMSRAACLAAAELPTEQAERLLTELIDEGVLLASDAGLRFAHETLRETLLSELTEPRRVRAHQLFADAELARDPDDRIAVLRAAVHRLRAGDLRGGRRLLKQVLARYGEGDGGTLAAAAPLVEQALSLLIAQRVKPHALLLPYAVLTFAGYLLDRRYALRYGDDALAAFERTLKLRAARALAPYLGRKLALYVALTIAAIGLFFRRADAPPLGVAVRMMLGTTSSLTGAATICNNPAAAARYAETIAPLTAFGEDHVASVVQTIGRTMVRHMGESRHEVVEAQRAIVARIEQGKVRGLSRPYAHQLLAGLYFSIGVCETRRDSDEALKIADRLERFSPLYAMGADYLRSSHYAQQGDFAKAEHFQRRMEVHAIQLGSTWQAETWAPLDAANLARRTANAPLMKRAMRELARLAVEIPSLAVQEQRARGFYLLLRGKPREAALALDTGEVPLAIVGWASTRAGLARAYSALNDHATARAICLDVLARLSPEDRTFTGSNLLVRIELALAEAGLGRVGLAAAQLDALITEHAPRGGSLTLGALYAARTEVALRQHDRDAARAALEATAKWYLPTGNQALVDIVDRLRRQIAQQWQPSEEERERAHDTHVRRRLQLMLASPTADLLERARQGLKVALDLSEAHAGFLLLRGHDRPVLADETPTVDLDLLHWARLRLAAAEVDVATERMDETSVDDENRKQFGDLTHRVLPLWSRRTGVEVLVGALVLGVRPGDRLRIDGSLVAVVARYLAEESAPPARLPG